MNFQLSKTRQVNWPVTVDVPQDGGAVKPHLFNVVFDIMSQDEYDTFMTEKSDIDFLMRVIVGFGDGLDNENGQPLAFSEANVEMLCKNAGFIRIGLINAYNEAFAGIASKNSKGSRASGRTAQKSRKRKSRS